MHEEVIENPNFSEERVVRHFSESYKQRVDNAELGYAEFMLHVKRLKGNVSHLSIEFLNIAQNHHTVFAKHIATSVM